MPLNRALRALSAAIITLAACNPKESGGTNAPAVAQYSIDDFYGNTRYFGASFSPDGQSLLTSSDQSGIFNAYAMPLAGGAPKALTSSTVNSVFAQGYFPKDERILFQSDSGGNELTHIYVRNTDGTTRDLTPGSKLKASFIGWANDDKSFFFISNERDPKHFDLYEVAAEWLRAHPALQEHAGARCGRDLARQALDGALQAEHDERCGHRPARSAKGNDQVDHAAHRRREQPGVRLLARQHSAPLPERFGARVHGAPELRPRQRRDGPGARARLGHRGRRLQPRRQVPRGVGGRGCHPARSRV